MSRPYHALQPPHGMDTLSLPDDDVDLRRFFIGCIERREFQEARSEREQVHLCARWSEACESRPSMRQLAEFFQISKSTVAYHLGRPFDVFEGCSASRVGRPGLLSGEQMTELEHFVRHRFDLRLPVSYEDVRDFLQSRWGLVMNIGSLRQIVARYEALKTVDGKPLEDSRLFSSQEQIDAYFHELEEVVQIGNIPAAFVCNVDESGFDQFVDARRSTGIVPTTYALNSVPVPVTRAEKRATMIGAICADGTALRPMIILQRETVEMELLLRGYTTEKVYLARSDTGFVNSKLFLEWGRTTFFPEFQRRRREFSYDGPGLLIMDGFGCHQTDEFLELALEANIICKFIPPHTSDQLQPLDLGVFGNQKRWQGNITVEADLNRQTKQVIKIYDSYRMATTPKNVIGAFRKAGLVVWFDTTTMMLMLRVDRQFATAIRDNENEMPTRNTAEERQRIRI